MAILNIEGHLHRLGKGGKLIPIWTRHYARIETATQRGLAFLMLDGEVGDVIEFTLKINGWQVGTMRLKAINKVEAVWNNDELAKEKNKKLQLESDKQLFKYRQPYGQSKSQH